MRIEKEGNNFPNNLWKSIFDHFAVVLYPSLLWHKQVTIWAHGRQGSSNDEEVSNVLTPADKLLFDNKRQIKYVPPENSSQNSAFFRHKFSV